MNDERHDSGPCNRNLQRRKGTSVHENDGHDFPRCGGNISGKPFNHTPEKVDCGKCIAIVSITVNNTPVLVENTTERNDLTELSGEMRSMMPDDIVSDIQSAFTVRFSYGGNTVTVDDITATDVVTAVSIAKRKLAVEAEQTVLKTWAIEL